MKRGALVSIIVAVLAVVGLGFVFVQNASPYMTIKEVGDSRNGVHVVGKIVPGTLEQNAMARQTRFTLEDETGTMEVVYTGPPLSNLASATQVVVIGDKSSGSFEAKKMLVKCPSKYESEAQAGAGS